VWANSCAQTPIGGAMSPLVHFGSIGLFGLWAKDGRVNLKGPQSVHPSPFLQLMKVSSECETLRERFHFPLITAGTGESSSFKAAWLHYQAFGVTGVIGAMWQGNQANITVPSWMEGGWTLILSGLYEQLLTRSCFYEWNISCGGTSSNCLTLTVHSCSFRPRVTFKSFQKCPNFHDVF